jgi:hypothetical protein
MSNAGGAAPGWPGGELMCQFMLAAARQFLAGGAPGAAAEVPPAGVVTSGATPEQLAFAAARLASPGGAAGTTEAARLAAEFFGQASVLAMASGFRYWRRLMRLADEHQTLAGRLGAAGVQAVSATDQRRLVDELRTLAREVGDAASQEGRQFALEMERLGLSLDAPPAGVSIDAPHRHARAKA